MNYIPLHSLIIGANGNINFQVKLKSFAWGCCSFIISNMLRSFSSNNQPIMLIVLRLGSRETHWTKDFTVAAWHLIWCVTRRLKSIFCKSGMLDNVWKKFLQVSSVILWLTERHRISSFWKPPPAATFAETKTMSREMKLFQNKLYTMVFMSWIQTAKNQCRWHDG